jgi:hypothetical protein
MARVLTDELSKPVTVGRARSSPGEGGVPASPGFYTWWTPTEDALPQVPPAPHPTDRSLRLLYVGIAPARITSDANLRSRVIGQHVGGDLGSSTFRRSLAALLWKQQGWHPFMTPGGKIAFTPEDNAALTHRQEHHLRVAWCVLTEP